MGTRTRNLEPFELSHLNPNKISLQTRVWILNKNLLFFRERASYDAIFNTLEQNEGRISGNSVSTSKKRHCTIFIMFSLTSTIPSIVPFNKLVLAGNICRIMIELYIISLFNVLHYIRITCKIKFGNSGKY